MRSKKAHEDVWNILLQILEDGVVTDAQGHKVDFRNTAVIMTSNIGAKSITAAGTPLGFAPEEQKKRRRAVRCREGGGDRGAAADVPTGIFEPRGRGDRLPPLIARGLRRDRAAAACADRFRAAALGITLEADENCAVSLAERGYDVSYGARPLRRLIRGEVEDALATCLLDGTLASGDTAVLAAKKRHALRAPAEKSGGRRPSATSARRRREKRDASDRRPDRWTLIGRVFMLVYGFFCGPNDARPFLPLKG